MAHNGMPLKTLVDEIGFQIVNRSTDYESINITTQVINRPGLPLTGFYDYFSSDRIQIMGLLETAYLQGFNTETRRQRFIDSNNVDFFHEFVRFLRQ